MVGGSRVRNIGGAVARHMAGDTTVTRALADAVGDGNAARRGTLTVTLQACGAVVIDTLVRLHALVRIVAGNAAERGASGAFVQLVRRPCSIATRLKTAALVHLFDL